MFRTGGHMWEVKNGKVVSQSSVGYLVMLVITVMR